jgi:hypothetical protein
MMVYAGCTPTAIPPGFGCMVSGQWRTPAPGVPYALDNGAFSAWKHGRPWDAAKFVHILAQVPADNPPDFIILPDIVGGGKRSLKRSLEWLRVLPDRWNSYLPVQEGMRPKDVEAVARLGTVTGLFVGGKTWKWKNTTTPSVWKPLADDLGIATHLARAGTLRRLKAAERFGVSSVDSTSFAKSGANGRPNRFHRVPSMRAQQLLTLV